MSDFTLGLLCGFFVGVVIMVPAILGFKRGVEKSLRAKGVIK